MFVKGISKIWTKMYILKLWVCTGVIFIQHKKWICGCQGKHMATPEYQQTNPVTKYGPDVKGNDI